MTIRPAFRVLVRTRPAAPPAVAPEPRRLRAADLSLPECWTRKTGPLLPLALRTDLEALARLGNGPANAALYVRDLARPDGARKDEIAPEPQRQTVTM